MKRKRTMKRKLAGFTKKGKSYALVFKKGTKLSLGSSRYRTKASLNKAAARYVK